MPRNKEAIMKNQVKVLDEIMKKRKSESTRHHLVDFYRHLFIGPFKKIIIIIKKG